jgi:hypothetical protein
MHPLATKQNPVSRPSKADQFREGLRPARYEVVRIVQAAASLWSHKAFARTKFGLRCSMVVWVEVRVRKYPATALNC